MRWTEYRFMTSPFIQNMDFVRPEIQELQKRGNISKEEWEQPMNSYERLHLIPALPDDVLADNIKYICENVCAHSATYEGALATEWVPELLKRFRERTQK